MGLSNAEPDWYCGLLVAPWSKLGLLGAPTMSYSFQRTIADFNSGAGPTQLSGIRTLYRFKIRAARSSGQTEADVFLTVQ